MDDTGQKKSSTVSFWINEIDTYDRQFGPWEKRAKNVVKRYADQRDEVNRQRARFNILWSNVQTLHPAIYANPPKPNIDRRYQDDDDLGRYAALVLERSVSYYVNNDLFDRVMKQTTLDRLLPGRGVAWIRYVPVFEEQDQITDDTETQLISEDVIPDYVHWQDFGHTWARTWQEVRGVWRRVYMGRGELVKRFGEEIGGAVPLDANFKGQDGETVSDSGKKACVYEIWDKVKRKAIWLHKDCSDVLDERDDPLKLKNFFPCPEPIYATLTNDSLIPTPDYMIYQDQAMELDMLTGRISSITKALKVAGVYDATAQGLDRLLSEGTENMLLPVEQWAVLGEKGLQGAISFMPLKEIYETLLGLYTARDKVKNDLYEITGISDIVRGATAASETATAQQIKGKFASLRLDNNQKDVARFSRDIVVIMTEIIASHFSLETIKKVSGIKLLTQAEKQQIMMQQQQSQMMAQQMGPGAAPVPDIPEDVQDLMDMPTWEEVDALIRDDTARSFRIDIETDSTIKIDQDAEKQARTEFLTAVSGFIGQAVQAPPDLQPLMMEMLLFGVRGFKVSRELETSFENVMSEIKRQKKNPPPAPPDPEQQRAEAEMQRTQAEMKIQQVKSASDMQQLQMKGQLDQQKAAADMQLKQADIQLKQMDIRLKELEIIGKQSDIVNATNEVYQPGDID